MKQIESSMPFSSTSLSLGDRCSSYSTCSNGGKCLEGICRCPANLVQASSSCLARETIASTIAQPGDSCQSGIFCDGGASCVNFECRCPSGLVIDNNVCTPVLADALSSCAAGERCSHGSLCVGGTCVCPSGFNAKDGNCVPIIPGNVAKSPGLNCLANPLICSGGSYCVQGICTCPIGTENNGGLCLPPTTGIVTYAPPGGQCIDGQIICTGNSVCANGICICPGGEEIRNDLCISIDSQADPGQMCELGITVCTGNSLCQNGICRCPDGETSLNGQCARVLTSFTLAPPICQPNCGTNSQCIAGSCQCNQGYYQTTQGQCQPSCSQPCSPNASCQQGSCQCNSGYLPSTNNNCYPASSPPLPVSPFYGLPGQPCDQRTGALLCRNRALCVNNQCICPTNLVLANQQCVEFAGDVNPGQSCTTPGVICRGGSSCFQGICKCDYGYFPSLQQCAPAATQTPFTFTFYPPIVQTTQSPYPFELRPGAQCDPRCEYQACLQRCGGGSLCIQGYCTCPLGSYDYQGTCTPMAVEPGTSSVTTVTSVTIPTARPGDNCDVSIKCTGGSSCLLGTCTCDTGYTPSFDRSSCILSSFPITQRSYPGQKCSLDSDCIGNSFCSGKVCSCLSDEEVKDRKCTRRNNQDVPYPGSPCTVSSMCQTGAICLQDYCICETGLTTNSTGHCVFMNQADTNSVLPGAPCSMGGPPCGGGAWCVDSHCLCPIGTINKGYGRCVEESIPKLPQPQPYTAVRGLGASCSLQSECNSILHANCIDYRCTCMEGYVKKDNQCIDAKSSGAVSKKSCASFRDCDSPRICSSSNLCECPFTMTETGNGVCVYRDNSVPPGSWCDVRGGVVCQSPSVCSDHLCTCPEGYVERNSQCTPQPTVLPGSSCTRGEVCSSGSKCTNGMCSCENGLSFDGRTCKSITKKSTDILSGYETDRVAALPKELLTPCPLDGSCKLPDCFCSRTGTVAPGGLLSANVPQMVILSFDDAVTDRTINIYKSMFNGKFRNPNGCPIKGTFFISHQWNNYDQTQWLHSHGNEIALNSITHETLMNATKERWRHEMVGLRQSLEAFSYVEENSIKGVRAPQLLMGGDAQFDMMSENSLLYDNSMPVREGPVWPQTLDHKLSWDCGDQNCPTRPHKGIWELPIQLMVANDGIWHTMARTAVKPYDSRESVRRLLQRNFYRNYNGNRAPFVLNADSDFLTYLPDNGVVHAIEDWLTEILNKTDVYVVTASQAVEWMRRPVAARDIAGFKPWQCNFRMNDHIQPCETPTICSYDSRSPAGMPHSFRVCGSCPKSYPWIEDPLGRKQLRRK